MDDSAPRKRPRISTGPRRRTGCLTCKEKHIKCDEAKPECDHCKRIHATCIYPDTTIATTRRKRDPSQLVFRNAWTPPVSQSLTTLNPSTDRASSRLGYQVLQYFHERTVPTIGHYVPSGFWSQTLLQMSESVPVIKHCIMALGSWQLSTDVSRSADNSSICWPKGDGLLFSTEKYGQAISALARDISASMSPSVDVTLAACILLAIYASLRGDQDQVVIHVEQGLKLVKRLCSADDQSSVVKFASRQLGLFHLGQQMRTPVFDVGSTSWPAELSRDTSMGTILDVSDSDSLLQSLSTGVQAMGDDVYAFLRKCNINYYADCIHLRNSDRENLQCRCPILRQNLSDALKAYPNVAGFRILSARFELSWIMLQVGWTLYQTPFDRHTAHFARIIRSAGEVLLPSMIQGCPLSFSVNLGLIPLLFYVARLCREPRLRRQAVVLLKACPRIEGLWNAREAAAVAEFVIALEEQVMAPDPDDDEDWADEATPTPLSIPEDRRVHSVRFHGASENNDPDCADLLDVEIMTRPEAIMSNLKTTKYRIRCEEWATGGGELSAVLCYDNI